MDAEILKFVGQSAGIGGVALGVLLLVFRDVVRKKVFPTLTREQAYKLLRLVLILVWFVALAGIGAWVWVSTNSKVSGVSFDDVNTTNFELPDPENADQTRSVKLLNWWRTNNRKLIKEKGKLNSTRYLTIWSQHFQKGRVIYNHVDGWAIIVNGETRSFTRIPTIDALITSGPGNSVIEQEVLSYHISSYSEEMRKRIVELIEQKKLLGGIGTLFIRDNLYNELGWPIDSEYLEREVIFGEGNDYFVFVGLQNRPGDSETECTMWFDKNQTSYTKQTNVNII